jgi:hypothetical protein
VRERDGLSVADLGGDSKPEVIVSPRRGGTVIKVFKSVNNGSGLAANFWPHEPPPSVSHHCWWKPAIGDVAGDEGSEIVIVQDEGSLDQEKSRLFVLSGATGDVEYNFEVPWLIGRDNPGPPMALADIDYDDRPEALAGTPYHIPGGLDDSKTAFLMLDWSEGGGYAVDTCKVSTPVPFESTESVAGNAGVLAGIVVADVDRGLEDEGDFDPDPEIFVGTLDFGVGVVDGGSMYGCDTDARIPWLGHEGEIFSTPQIFEDTSTNPHQFGLIVQDGGGRIVLYELPREYDASLVEWAGFGNGPSRTGLYVPQGAGRTSGVGLVTDAGLGQNVPNPFNPSTTLTYQIPEAEHVRLAVFDVGGRRVRTLVDRREAPGEHAVVSDGSDDGGRHVGSGVFFYRLEVGPTTFERRMILLR